jgi:hypothetical protein
MTEDQKNRLQQMIQTAKSGNFVDFKKVVATELSTRVAQGIQQQAQQVYAAQSDRMQEEYESEAHEEDLSEEELQERMARRTIVVRQGKRKIRWRCPPGFVQKDRLCIKQSSSQRIRKSRSMKKAARKRRARKATINRKRKRSVRLRKGLGL